jgi:hypothetical protein
MHTVFKFIGKILSYLFDAPGAPRKNSDKYDVEGKIHPASGVRIWPDGRCACRAFRSQQGYVVYKHRGYFWAVHVQVAELYVPKPVSVKRLVVNHIDGNKLNPHADNLEWISYSENTKHAYRTGLIKKNKHVKIN